MVVVAFADIVLVRSDPRDVTAIVELAVDCAPCIADAECDDGVFCNGAEYCDEFGFCDRGLVPSCDDGVFCTYDTCVDNACAFTPVVYGDADHDDVDIFDIFCVLDGFAGEFETCALSGVDIGNCEADGVVDIFDIFGVLDGFVGLDPCCAE